MVKFCRTIINKMTELVPILFQFYLQCQVLKNICGFFKMVFTLRLYSSRPDLHGRLPVYNFTFNLKGKEMHYPSMYVQIHIFTIGVIRNKYMFKTMVRKGVTNQNKHPHNVIWLVVCDLHSETKGFLFKSGH